MAWIRQQNRDLLDIDYIHPPEQWTRLVECKECGAGKEETFWRIRGGGGGHQYEELCSCVDPIFVKLKYLEFTDWLKAGHKGIFTF